MTVHRTVVFADLSGSTRVFELLGDIEAAKLMTQQTDWMSAMCEQYGGKVVKLLGDGVLMLFTASDDAIEAAVAMQRRHQRRLPKWPRKLRMHLRIGVASGRIVAMREDCYGEAVNLASRLSDLAGEGQIWAADSVLREQGGRLPVPARDLGLISVQGLAHQRRVFQVEWDNRPETDLLTLLGEEDPSIVHLAADPAFLELKSLHERSVFPVAKLPIHLGRDAQADLVLRDPKVSRRHAHITWANSAFILTDTSSYGTWIRFSGSGSELRLRRGVCMLHGRGDIACGTPFTDPDAVIVSFNIVDSRGVVQPSATWLESKA